MTKTVQQVFQGAEEEFTEVDIDLYISSYKVTCLFYLFQSISGHYDGISDINR